MPHLHIEYTANLDGLDPRRVLDAAMAALRAQGIYDMPTAKGRIRALDHHAVDHPDCRQAFISVVLTILPGPTPEQRHRTSAAITEAVASAVPRCTGTQVRTEVREMDPCGYTSHNVR